MKFALKGIVFAAVVTLGLGAGSSVWAADADSRVLDQDQQRIFAELDNQDLWGGGGGGGGGGDWDGDTGGGSGGGLTGGGGGAVVPEPGTMALLGMGLAALGAARRKKQKKA